MMPNYKSLRNVRRQEWIPTPYLDKINNPEKAPEQVKIEALMEKMAPGIVTDPENIDIFNIDLSVMDEIKAYTDELAAQKTAEAKAQIKVDAEKLKQHAGCPPIC
ncbi:hypothetical protein [uncultured Paraglaciecola sp.]|uniref:hypothetical protein n=1 Tax=uncultured Paraglaciecola sp. TaxID=1765024 RepID=UPI00261D9C8E|nr:hypothetical protein [uncultured Paraglaciecola sp.]